MNKINEFFEELETTKEYNGYFCSVADALNCQKETAEIVVKGKADYLLCVKNNQASLKKNIEDYVQDESLHKEMDVISKAEKNRERKEKRTAYITNDIKWLENCKDWEGLTCIGAIHTEIESKKGKTSE